jgi:hypothetical protein
MKVQQVLSIITQRLLRYTIEHKNVPEKRRSFWQAVGRHLISEN